MRNRGGGPDVVRFPEGFGESCGSVMCGPRVGVVYQCCESGHARLPKSIVMCIADSMRL